MDVRMIAMDLDGTLLDDQQKVSDQNARALRACVARGIRLALASGRSFESTRLFAREMGIDCAILSCNGARIDLSPFGPTLLERTIEPARSERVYAALKAAGVYFVCYAANRVYMNNRQVLRFRSHEPSVRVVDGYVQEYVDDEGRMRAEAMDRAYKYVAFCDDPAAFGGLREQLAGLGVNVSSSWSDNVEVMERGVHKGSALGVLADHFGVARSQVMAFGDNLNDLDMLSFAGVPVAMGNALDELKAAAQIIAPRCSDSGVGRIIERHVLGAEAAP